MLFYKTNKNIKDIQLNPSLVFSDNSHMDDEEAVSEKVMKKCFYIEGDKVLVNTNKAPASIYDLEIKLSPSIVYDGDV